MLQPKQRSMSSMVRIVSYIEETVDLKPLTSLELKRIQSLAFGFVFFGFILVQKYLKYWNDWQEVAFNNEM